MSVTIKLRKGTAAEWSANSSIILASGEPGFEIDTGRLKIGNGSTQWGSLQYASIIPSGFIAGSGIGINLGTNGSTANISVSGSFVANSGTFNQVVFNTGLADPNLLAGQLQWNSTEGTLDLGLNDSYAMHLGEEMLYRVRNTTGTTLLAGQPVYASGLSPGGNNRIEVNLYAADGTINEIRFMGLMTEDLPNGGSNGYATHFGYIRGIDTRGDAATYGTTNKLWSTGEPAWNEGDILYVHPTVPGKLTKIEPKHSISVAIITNKASNGKLFVRPTNYGHLDDNHDVNVSGVTNGQFLQYNSLTDYWVPSSSGTFTILNVDNLRLDGNTLSSTTGNIIINPSGTGALQRDAGGNARGQYAVDWQSTRYLSTQVSSGNNSVIGGGLNNTSSGNSATVGGGVGNTSSGYRSTVAGGGNNTSSSYSATVGGGAGNTSSGYRSTVAGGGNNTSSGNSATVGGGVSNTSSGYSSTISGGLTNTSTGDYSAIPGGLQAKASRHGELSHAAGMFSNNGDAQHTTLIARTQTLSGDFTVSIASPAVFTKTAHNLKVGDAIRLSTTGSLPTGLNTTTTYYVISTGIGASTFRVSTTLNGAAVNTSGSQIGTHSLNITSSELTLNGVMMANPPQRLTIPAETTWTFSIKLSAYNDTDNQGAWWIFRGGIRRNASNGTALIGSLITESGAESSLSTATASVVADDTIEALQINVGGVSGKNIRWVAVVDISQVIGIGGGGEGSFGALAFMSALDEEYVP